MGKGPYQSTLRLVRIVQLVKLNLTIETYSVVELWGRALSIRTARTSCTR